MRKLLLAAGITCAASAVWAPSAIASAACEHTGPPANELRVLAFQNPNIDLDFADGDVYRDGDSIRVKSLDPVPCSGPPATLAGTERVTILQNGLSFNRLALSGGPLWPGGSPESDGTAETEVSFDTAREDLGYGSVTGTRRADSWVLSGASGVLGVSLAPERRHELDVLFEGTGSAVPVLELGAGNDVLEAFLTSTYGHSQVFVLASGGGGNDRLTTSNGAQALDGGRGNDLIASGPGSDQLGGGAGKDRLLGGKGKDTIGAQDGDRDLVRCGPQRDRAEVDRKDNVRGCEKVKRL
jgi:hypothetical protein